MEDKQAICDALLITLKQTRRYRDAQSIKYYQSEIVKIKYNDGTYSLIDVAHCNGIDMIKTILKNI